MEEQENLVRRNRKVWSRMNDLVGRNKKRWAGGIT
jgi:hypothetical protein